MRFCTLVSHKQIVTRAAQSKKNTENSIYTPTGSLAADRRFKITALTNHNLDLLCDFHSGIHTIMTF